MHASFDTPLTSFPRIGTKTGANLKRLGLETARDVLYWFPNRYEDFRNIEAIGNLRGNSYTCVRGKIRLLSARRSPRKWLRFSEGLIEDATGSIKVIWFNQPYIATSLHEGDEIFVAGRIDIGKYGMQFVNPVYEPVSDNPTHTARIVPVYPAAKNITQKLIRALVKAVLPLADKVKDPLPEHIRKQFSLMPLSAALRIVHFPVTAKHAAQARTRIALQELVDLLQSLQQAVSLRKKDRGIAYPDVKKRITSYAENLPFRLTKSQMTACSDISHDLEQKFPMKRLLNGDVGSGKTIIAHITALSIALKGDQAVLLAPTDILAQQHFRSFQKLFPDQQVAYALFTRTSRICVMGSEEKQCTKKELLEAIAQGKISYVIGTHAVIQKGVFWKSLGLAIVDEQHRFGVLQRGELLTAQTHNGLVPHYLSLTATPIPRSLARLLFTGADVSLLTEKPGKRKPITTKVLHETERETAYVHIRKAAGRGEQIFVICPIIEESDTLGVKAATQVFEDLSRHVFPDLSTGLLHGKLPQRAKDQTMSAFANGKLDILVATAVVEVGVDIPNATIMLIEGAERFGLAQLHQFRGRIGRNDKPATCYAIQTENDKGINPRLHAFEKTSDGFALAKLDLELRGPGALFGTVQSGFLPLKLANLGDAALLARAQEIHKTLSRN